MGIKLNTIWIIVCIACALSPIKCAYTVKKVWICTEFGCHQSWCINLSTVSNYVLFCFQRVHGILLVIKHKDIWVLINSCLWFRFCLWLVTPVDARPSGTVGSAGSWDFFKRMSSPASLVSNYATWCGINRRNQPNASWDINNPIKTTCVLMILTRVKYGRAH